MPHPKRRITNCCVICNNNFEVQLSSKYKKITCSKECSSKNRTIKLTGKKHNVEKRYNKCLKCNEYFLLNGVVKKKKTAKFCSKICQNKHHSESISGEKSHNWKGGKTNTNSRSEFKKEIYEWRNKVLKRDGYKCVKCNNKNNLEAHHIVYWSQNVELRFVVSNGMTLCVFCHGKEHNINFKVRKINYCVDCKTEIIKTSKRCLLCYKLARKNKVILNRK